MYCDVNDDDDDDGDDDWNLSIAQIMSRSDVFLILPPFDNTTNLLLFTFQVNTEMICTHDNNNKTYPSDNRLNK